MPTGIGRSTFTRPFADVLGVTLGTVRNFYIRQGYPAPYDDIHRALRLHKKAGHDIAKLLKSVSMRAEDVTWDPPQQVAPTPSRDLVLTPAPSQPPPFNGGAPDVSVPRKLIARLARATPEGDTPENQDRLRKILNDNNYDLRSRNEDRALIILKNEGITLENFVSLRDLSPGQNETAPDIESMGVLEARKYAHSLAAENDALRLELITTNLRLGKVGGMLEISKNRAFKGIRNGRDDFTDAELAALNARAVIRHGQLEDV
jgi:hypothetical protein